MSLSFFIYGTGTKLGYIASQFIQGALLAGSTVYTNVTDPVGDGRHFPADFSDGRLQYKEQPSLNDYIVIDETRFLAETNDLGLSFFNFLESRPDRDRICFLYYGDDANYLNFPVTIPSFVVHQVKGFRKKGNIFPVPFGVTLEMISNASATRHVSRIRNRIIQNFNSTYNQSVRESILVSLQSRCSRNLFFDEQHLFGEAYSSQLKECQFIFAFGGRYYWPRSDYQYMRSTMDDKALEMDRFDERDRKIGVLRWDSFRLWEGMLYGCVPITLDFERYGFDLPFVPEPWKHYIPIDLYDVRETFDRLEELVYMDHALAEMSHITREWCLEHAHPTRLYQYVLREAYKIDTKLP